jgi:hypothetical protein
MTRATNLDVRARRVRTTVAALTVALTALGTLQTSAEAAAKPPSDHGKVQTQVTMSEPRDVTSPLDFYCPNLVDCHPTYRSSRVELRGTLTTSAGDPISGRVLHLANDYGSCASTTGADGVAACSFDGPPGRRATGTFAGDDMYAPSTGTWTAA